MGADWNSQIGNAIPFSVHYGHTKRWSIPALKAQSCNAFMAELKPLMQKILRGYKEVWDHSQAKNLPRFTSNARNAIERIEELCQGKFSDNDEILQVWDAQDWFGSIGSHENQRKTLGITTNTTDEELEIIIKNEIGGDIDILNGAEEYLKELRDEAIEEELVEVA